LRAGFTSFTFNSKKEYQHREEQQCRNITPNTAEFKAAGFLILGLPLFNSISVRPVYAVSYLVTKTTDANDGVCDADCSLREAIGAA
jgi:CSLREA domain-containing protein